MKRSIIKHHSLASVYFSPLTDSPFRHPCDTHSNKDNESPCKYATISKKKKQNSRNDDADVLIKEDTDVPTVYRAKEGADVPTVYRAKEGADVPTVYQAKEDTDVPTVYRAKEDTDVPMVYRAKEIGELIYDIPNPDARLLNPNAP